MDFLLANQHIIMANQTELQAHQQALERKMDKMENLMLQILKALQKGKINQLWYFCDPTSLFCFNDVKKGED